MNSRTYYYARVSTSEQNLDRQFDEFKSLGADDRIHSRQKAGIESAKSRGIHLGRPPLKKPENRDIVIADCKNITAKQAMTQLNLKKSSFYKLLKAE